MARQSSFKLPRNIKPIIYFAAAIIIIILLIVLLSPRKKYTGNAAPKSLGGYAAFERFENSIKGKLMLFHADWCPHCKEYEKAGTFDKLSTDTRLSHIAFEKIDVDQKADVAAKYGVPSFPTLVLADAKGDKLGVFEGNRNDIDEIIKFVNSKILA